MRVVIVGAGEVGWYLAQRLGAEGNDIVVVEQDEKIAAAIGAELDVQVVVGNATVPSTLRNAGIERAELLAGVTQNDEVNLMSALLAKQAGVPQTVVRIQIEELRGPDGGNVLEVMGADVVIDPDADTADEILELARAIGADELYPMSDGDLVVLGAVIGAESPLVGQTLADVGRAFEPRWRFLVGALTRDAETVIPRGDQRLEAGDHVRVLTSRQDRASTLELLGVAERPVRRVMVLGGGAVGARVARQLRNDGAEVVLVEHDPDRARTLSEKLAHVTIVRGDITDTDMLDEESIGSMDLVIAATGDDASNVLACAYAAAESDAFTVAVLHRLALLPLVRQFGINAALSPRTASANAVLRQIRRGTASVATFLESDVEVDEIAIAPNSAADGAQVAELNLPHSLVLGAVTRPWRAGADRARPHGAARRGQGGRLRPAGVAAGAPPGVRRRREHPRTVPTAPPIAHGGRRHRCDRRQRGPGVNPSRGERLLAPRRRPSLVGNVVGLVLAVVGVAIAGSAVVAVVDGGGDALALGICGIVIWAAGSVLWRTTIIPRHIRIVDVYITVTVAWLAMVCAGAVPYLATGTLTGIDLALFEAVSGFTTTGATVISDIEAVSHGTLFWRSTTQWLGGMGVIVLVVAVLPTIGAGGMHLISAEAPGPTGERLTPRVRETASNLWKVYVGFTVVLAGAYAVAGMNLYDAVSHSFTTVSTGGFSPYQGSLGHFDSAAIEWIACVGMFLAGGSFTLYFRALRKDPKPLLRSTELRAYFALVTVVVVIVVFSSGNGGRTVRRRARRGVHHALHDHHDRLRGDRVRAVEPGGARHPAGRDAARRDGRFHRGRRQDRAPAGGRQLRPSRGPAAPAPTPRASRAHRCGHRARRHRRQDRRVRAARTGDLRWGRDRDRARPARTW